MNTMNTIITQPPKKEQLKAVLFDMDGVLYNSMNTHAQTWEQSFARFGIPMRAEEAYIHEGRTGKEFIDLTIRKRKQRNTEPQEVEAIYAEKTRLMNSAPPSEPVEGIIEVLALLRRKNIKVIVVTGSQQPSLLDKLHHDFGVAPGEVVAANDVSQGKPHPEPFLQGLKKAGSLAGETIVIENAPLGVESAKAAGIYTIALNTGILSDRTLIDAGANNVFKDAKSIKEWFEKEIFQ